jgi:hypothetical protein
MFFSFVLFCVYFSLTSQQKRVSEYDLPIVIDRRSQEEESFVLEGDKRTTN